MQHTTTNQTDRYSLRVWFVVDETTGTDLTGPLTFTEASTELYVRASDPRPNAVEGFMYIVEREVEVFSETAEAAFTELQEAGMELSGAKLSLSTRSCGTPMWRVEQMGRSVETAREHFNQAMDTVYALGDEAGSFPVWRRQRGNMR